MVVISIQRMKKQYVPQLKIIFCQYKNCSFGRYGRAAGKGMDMAYYKGTLGLIGNTPLVEVTNIEKELGLEATVMSVSAPSNCQLASSAIIVDIPY